VLQRRPCECGRGEATGIHLGDRPIWTKCEVCQQEAEAAGEAEAAQRKEAEKREVHEARVTNAAAHLKRIGINRLYREKTLGTFNPDADPTALREAQRVVNAYLSGERPSLYLFSERPGERLAPGTGKTHLACGILHTLALNPDVKLADLGFVFVPELLMEIQATFKHPEKSELEVVKKYAAPELLVWDDFGAEKLSDYAARTLFTLLYKREGRSNVFTSNLSLDAIEGRDPSGYTQRITSRIVGDARIVRMTGPDRRFGPRAA
jgi:DNA replication protein DnaC